MEIAAYPVPYSMPGLPVTRQVRPVDQSARDLSPSQQDGRSAREQVLQGEVLNGQSQRSGNRQQDNYYTFEQQARRQRPDLSGLSPYSRDAIETYLDNGPQDVVLNNARSLIDVFV